MRTLVTTPDLLRRAYELLRQTPPFKGWRLPEAEMILFEVTRARGVYGEYWYDKARGHVIRVSQARHAYLPGLLATVAHEMIHLRQDIVRAETPKTHHNAQFRRIALLACRTHGWDEKLFFFF